MNCAEVGQLMLDVQAYILSQIYNMSSGKDRTAEEIQKEIDRMQAEIERLKKHAEEMAIAKRATEININMSDPLPSGKDYEDFEQELRDRAAAEEAEVERAYFEHLGQKLREKLNIKKNNGGKNKRKSHKYKNHKNKSHKYKNHKNKRKSYKRSKH